LEPTDSNQRFKYFAFISYSRKDEKWARWLHSKLENYKLPNVLIKESGSRLPKEIRPVFLDKTDIGLGDLQQNLSIELEDSRFLIVICSPNAAKSEWVNKEVQKFNELGRERRIIPFIIDGTPNNKNEKEQCYPPSLGKNILGASLAELSKEQALTKIVASMLGLKFDELWRRQKRQEKKRKIIAYLCTGVFFLIALLAFFCIWDYNHVKTKYYADYVDRWGIPCGVLELTSDQISNRTTAFYEFKFQRRKLRSVKLVNSAHVLTENSSVWVKRPTNQQLFYDETTGKLEQINFLDQRDSVLVSNKYSGSNEVDFKTRIGTNAMLINSLSNIRNNIYIVKNEAKTKINHYTLTRNLNGEIVKIRYRYANDFVSDLNGIFGEKYVLDTIGRVVKISYVNSQDEPQEDESGVTHKIFKYDSNGNIERIENTGKDDQRILNKYGWAEEVFLRDREKNTVTAVFLGTDSQLCVMNDGFSIATIKTVPNTGQIEFAYFDKYRNPCTHRMGYAKFIAKHDKRGNNIEEAYFDIDGNRCMDVFGYARLVSTYDDNDNVIEESYFNISGNPCTNSDGFAKFTAKYDNNSRQIAIDYFGIDGKPCLNKQNYSKFRKTFDELGNLVEMCFLGTNGKLCLNINGYAKYTHAYDDRGNIIEEAYWGADDELCISDKGYARQTSRNDEKGNEIENVYWGTDGKHCADLWGVSKYIKVRDEKGNIIEIRCFDENDNPTLHKDGYSYAKITNKYNGKNHIVEESYFGIDGKPCLSQGIYSKLTTIYDGDNRITEYDFWGLDGHLCLNNENYSISRGVYDNLGNLVQMEYFGRNGERCLHVNGYSKIIAEYGAFKNLIRARYFGIDGKPRINKMGYAEIREKYNERNELVGENKFDLDGNAVQ
jgi:TIR domain-containing protein